MAGDWIPWCKGLTRKSEVIKISSIMQMSRREVAATLMDFWDWADDETTSGKLSGFTVETLADVIQDTSVEFWLAVVQVGWLKQLEDVLQLPNFGRWLGNSAKKRLQKNSRQARWRAAGSREEEEEEPNDVDVQVDVPAPQKAPTREPNRREPNTKDPPTPQGGDPGRQPSALVAETDPAPAKLDPQEFILAWNAVPKFTACKGLTGKRLRHFQTRARDRAWLATWRQALERAARSAFCTGDGPRAWRATVDWFLRPETVTKILEGQYDQLATGRNGTREHVEQQRSEALRERHEREAQEAEQRRRAAEEATRKPPTPEQLARGRQLLGSNRKEPLP